MFGAAIPAVVVFQEPNVFAATGRTGNTIRPAPRYQILTAVGRISKVQDGFLQGLRFGGHD